MTLDAIFLGDSHTITLREGAEKLQMNCGSIQFSGAAWHQGKFGWSNKDGFLPRRWQNGKLDLDRLREKLGGVENVFSLQIPIVASVGFHLGLLTGPFSWFGHKVPGAFDRAQQNDGALVSSQFVSRYISHYRMQHIRFLKRMSRRCNVVVVAPPNIPAEPNLQYIRAEIVELMRKNGLNLFDPVEFLFGEDMTFPNELVADDGNHGTPEYGEMVMKALRENELLVPA